MKKMGLDGEFEGSSAAFEKRFANVLKNIFRKILENSRQLGLRTDLSRFLLKS